MTHLTGLDQTVQKTNEWLRDIGNGLGIENRRTEYAALRATLHAIRDHLSTDEIAHLGAQLPLAIRGLYYEGWNPSNMVSRPRNAEEFLEAVGREVQSHSELWDVGKTVRVALNVISEHITPGEMKHVVQHLPAGIRGLWIGNIS
jgi:uncharacterized protein (DUF2267 family)